MSIFKRNKSANLASNHASQAEMALRNIRDGVIITDKPGVIQFINPAAVSMIACGSADQATGLDYGLLIKIESKEGRELPDAENPLVQAMRTGQSLDNYQACLILDGGNQRLPVAISVLPADGGGQYRIITLRNIARELAEEGEQTEFISTASHEMRTPVATIDGYISLALNPQTATIDPRARGYLTAAQAASRHLGKLFQNLLDITKLDDGKIRPEFVPVDMIALVKSIAEAYIPQAQDGKVSFKFGPDDHASPRDIHRMEQVVYGYVDINFMHEILDNLIENAIKYTPAGGSIYLNVRGDGDRVLINVTDTGIGISAEDIGHIFQKFYRADNSDTRTVGGTGLGLYIVKQRAEAMGGKVWAESSFGEGSTFYVSLPRLTSAEYDKRMIAFQGRNQQITAVQPRQAAPQSRQITPQPLQVSPQLQPSPASPLSSAVVPHSYPNSSPRPAQYSQTLQPRAPTIEHPRALSNFNNKKGINQ